MALSLILDKRFRLLSDPVFESCGFMHLSDAENMRREFVDAVRHTVKKASSLKGVDLELVENKVVSRCRELLRKYTGSSPKVIPMITVMDR